MNLVSIDTQTAHCRVHDVHPPGRLLSGGIFGGLHFAGSRRLVADWSFDRVPTPAEIEAMRRSPAAFLRSDVAASEPGAA